MSSFLCQILHIDHIIMLVETEEFRGELKRVNY